MKEVKSNRAWREECEALRREIDELRAAKVGTVEFIRSGGNAGLAWYVRPCSSSIIPNQGDLVYVVTPKATC